MTVAATVAETLTLSHYYEATPAKVFAAWSDPEALGQWFGPHSHKCKVEKYDFKQNGDYQIRMIPVAEDTDCGGDSTQDSVCAGKFVEIVENARIVMTFTWIENGGDIGETLLTIELKERDGGTELTLSHERLPNEDMYEAHKGGWQGSLEGLEAFLGT